MVDEALSERRSLATWFVQLVHGPSEPLGDYFDRLRVTVELSAPLCTGSCA